MPITLLNTMYKLIDKIANIHRIAKSFQCQGWADEFIFGFKKGKSTIDAILLLKLTEEWAETTKKNACFASIDVTKAYDRVDRKKVLATIHTWAPEETHIFKMLWAGSKIAIFQGGIPTGDVHSDFGLR